MAASAASGKWYEGVYGWAFSPVVPQTGKREDRNRVPRSIVAFMNAALLTGDDRYMAVWRRQNAAINSQRERNRRRSCRRHACAGPRAGTATRRARIA